MTEENSREKTAMRAGGVEPLRKRAAAPQAVQPAVPERGEVLVTVSGFTGSGKSAIAGEIEIMCRALGLQVEWPDGVSEKNMTGADWQTSLELYKPRVRIVESNLLAAPAHPAEGVSGQVLTVDALAEKLRSIGVYGGNAEKLMPFLSEYLAATHPTQQGLDAQALKQSFREYLSVSEHIDAGGHAMDSIATDLTRIVLAEEEVSAVIARRVHCNTSGQAGEDAANIRAAAQAKQGGAA